MCVASHFAALDPARVFRRWAAAMALALFGTGCTSFGTMHTARSVPQGVRHVSASTGVVAYVDDDGLPDEAGIDALIPTVAELEVRTGVAPSVDFGARVYPFGVLFDLNLTLLDSPWFALSINPALGGFFLSDDEADIGSSATGFLTLLMDIGPDDVTTLTVGPRVGFWAFAVDSDADLDGEADLSDSAGSFLGAIAMWRVWLGPQFAVSPEASVYLLSGEYLGRRADIIANTSIGLTWVR